MEKHLGPLRACYMKGRANYACRQKIYDAEKEPVLAGLEEVADFQMIRAWEKTTETGDRAEIKSLPEHSPAWAKIDARGELCTGQKCPQFERCFITRMHQKARKATDHRQSSSVLRRSRGEGRRARRDHPRLRRRDLR